MMNYNPWLNLIATNYFEEKNMYRAYKTRAKHSDDHETKNTIFLFLWHANITQL